MNRKACCYGKTLLCISGERRKIHITLKGDLEQRCSVSQEAGSWGCPPHLRRQNSSLLFKALAGVPEKGWAPSCWVQVHLPTRSPVPRRSHLNSGHCRGQKASLSPPLLAINIPQTQFLPKRESFSLDPHSLPGSAFQQEGKSGLPGAHRDWRPTGPTK